MVLITMSHQELDRLKVIQDFITRRTTPKAAAQMLGLTRRQLYFEPDSSTRALQVLFPYAVAGRATTAFPTTFVRMFLA